MALPTFTGEEAGLFGEDCSTLAGDEGCFLAGDEGCFLAGELPIPEGDWLAAGGFGGSPSPEGAGRRPICAAFSSMLSCKNSAKFSSTNFLLDSVFFFIAVFVFI